MLIFTRDKTPMTLIKYRTIRKGWMEMPCKNSRQENSKMPAMLQS
jgi:hypothetical protein